jgi:tetratricopeptide (TPR) repeat protein
MTDRSGITPAGGVGAAGERAVAAGQISAPVITGNESSIDARQINLPPGVLLSPNEVTAPTATRNLPRRPSAVFVGRDTDLAALDEAAGSGVGVITQAIQGLGGIGKTELALHHAWQHKNDYPLVWWITADSPDNLDAGLAELAYRLHPVMKAVATAPEATQWARAWLQAHAGWLLVLDNVEDPQQVAALLAQLDRGRVLITTRRDVSWARLGATPLRLGLLARAESIDLLARLTGRDESEAADTLARELGDLPLALEQAGAYITERHSSISAYLTDLRNRPRRLLDTAGVTGAAERAVARVWDLTMTTITDRLPLAARLLEVLAWVAPDDLPRDLLTPIADDRADLDDALALLASYNMITLTGTTVSVHRLVQAVTRAHHTHQTNIADTPTGHPGLTAGQMLTQAAPPDPRTNVAGWPRWRALLPHVDALADHLPETTDDAAVSYLLNVTALYQHGQGQLPAAITKVERAHTSYRRILDEDHPDTLASANNLAYTYQAAGRLDEAIALHKATHTSYRRILGEDHPQTLTSANNLAGAYRAAGRLDEAIALHEATHTARRRVLGEDHPDTLSSANNLALAYREAGRLDEAITLYEVTHTACRRVLGEDHPDTLTSTHNLAGAYQAAGRLDEAITLHEATHTAYRRVLGEDHPDTLSSANILAYTYQAAGLLDEALALHEATHTARRRFLGEDHPDTLSSANNLATAYQAAGQLDEAVALYEATHTSCRQVLGEDHPDTLASANNLGGAYRVARRVDEAILLFEATHTSYRRILGEDHPHTLTSAHNLAGAYQAAGRLDEAIALYEPTHTTRRGVLGEDHPHTLASASNLAGAYQTAGRLDEAIALYEPTHTTRRGVLGEDHPDTLGSANNLATAYWEAGRLDAAIALYEATHTASRGVLGEDHPHTLTSANNLAYAYQAAGRLDEAIALFEATLTASRRILGDDHPNTRTIRENLDAARNPGR